MSIVFYSLATIALGFSFLKSKTKTKLALKKAWKSFEHILPQFLSIILLIGMILSIVDDKFISSILGEKSGYVGLLFASVVGSVTLVPSFVAFPLAASLIENGAGYMQIAAFISTLMMVGLITIPLEKQYFGLKATLIRNGLAFIFSIIVGLVIGGII